MASIPGLGGITKKGTLKKEVDKIDKDINELFEEFRSREPAMYAIAPLGIDMVKDLIDKILKDIEKYKKDIEQYVELLRKKYKYNLKGFPEIHQLENSIKEILKKLEEGNKQIRNPPKGTKLEVVARNIDQNINAELHKIGELWNTHKHELYQLRIIK
jgi:hypothetical protein